MSQRLSFVIAASAALSLVATACGTGAADEASTTSQTPERSTTTAQTTTTATATGEELTSADESDESGDVDETDGATTECPGVEPGLSTINLDVNGIDYTVRVHVPDNYAGSPDAPAPVVVNWHGLGSDGSQQATYTGYEALANSEGFLAVHPTGPPVPGTDQNAWDFGVFTDQQLSDLGVDIGGRDDLAMAEQLIDLLIAEWCGDEARVYSTGLSNGGFFTASLICNLGDRIAAAVVVAGLTYPDDCDPTAAVPLLAYHGTADDVVPYEGGGQRELPTGVEVPPEVAALFDRSIADEFARFAETFGCSPEPGVDEQSDEVTAYRYDGCDGDRFAITLFEISGGGHTWPGSPLGVILAPVLGETTLDVDATADGWEYMSSFRR